MAASTDPSRIERLEGEIRELQAVHAQLAAYARDLNRTYQELRTRLQQMTTLSAHAARLARARTVEAATRACIEGVHELFPDSVGSLFLEDRREALKLVARYPHDSNMDRDPAVRDLASAALETDEPLSRRDVATSRKRELVGIGLHTRGKAFGALIVARDVAFDEDDVRVFDLLSKNVAVTIANARLYQQSRRLARTDALTGLPNLRHFRAALAQELQKAKRFHYPIAVIMADIDHFKMFNDTYGHPKGNVALRRIAKSFTENLRQTDIVARYGGEEFSAILPGCDRPSLLQVAEKVRSAVEQISIPVSSDRPPVHLTISIGGAWQEAANADPQAIVAAADEALYAAKAMGRNCSHIRPD